MTTLSILCAFLPLLVISLAMKPFTPYQMCRKPSEPNLRNEEAVIGGWIKSSGPTDQKGFEAEPDTEASLSDIHISASNHSVVKRNARDSMQILKYTFASAFKPANREYDNYVPKDYRNIDKIEVIRIPGMSWTAYHRLDTIYKFLYDMEERHPGLVQIEQIGTSYEGRPILMCKVSKKPEFGSARKPVILLEAGIHGREWISPAVATFIINELVTSQRFNSDVLDIYDFFIIPVLNPDGYEYSHVYNRMWRKNRSHNALLGKLFSFCRGVDLNRNFEYSWGAITFFDSRTGTNNECLETYVGPTPFSERESSALGNVLIKYRSQIHMYFSLHSYGQKIIYPWSHTAEPLPDWQELHQVGEKMARAIEQVNGDFYTVSSPPNNQYMVTGSSSDWARGRLHLKWTYLIELPDQGRYGFILPPSYILSTSNSVMNAIRVGALEVSPARSGNANV